jgi:hypothetical protein
MNTDKCTKISPLNLDFKPVFCPNFGWLWIKENARKPGIFVKKFQREN